MKASFLLALASAALTSVQAVAMPEVMKNKNHLCGTRAECEQKCECEHGGSGPGGCDDGGSRYWPRWDKATNTTELRCRGRHRDYLYRLAACRYEMSGPAPAVTWEICKQVHGLFCQHTPINWAVHLKCLVHPDRYDEFKTMCIRTPGRLAFYTAGYDMPWDCNPQYVFEEDLHLERIN